MSYAICNALPCLRPLLTPASGPCTPMVTLMVLPSSCCAPPRHAGLIEKRRKVFADVLRQYLPSAANTPTAALAKAKEAEGEGEGAAQQPAGSKKDN